MESFLYVIRSIVALIIVIWLANLALKYINNYSNNTMKSIQIIERISVSKASSLAIVKIVSDYYLMSFSDNASETIRKFTDEEAIEIEEKIALQEQSDPVKAMKDFDLSRLKSVNLKTLREKYSQLFE